MGNSVYRSLLEAVWDDKEQGICIAKNYFVAVYICFKKFTLQAEHIVCISTNVLL